MGGLAALFSGGMAASAAGTAVTSAPNDPGFVRHQQWGLVQAGFPTAWCRSTGAGALVVVLDTGVDAAHPDLGGKLVGQARVQNGVLTTGPGVAADDSGHGTHVAGIAVADTNNGVGVAGAAPGARLYAIKVLFAPQPGQPEEGSPSDLAQAIDYATDVVAPSWPGPVVLNISIGSADASSTSDGSGVSDSGGEISTAISHAYSRGLAVALAAANTGTSPIGGTAVQDGQALSVGALDQNGAVASYSPTSGVSVFAAGGAANASKGYIGTGIISTWPHTAAGDYAWMAGTSMAAPHVSAALALLMSTGMSNAQAYARLLQTEDSAQRLHVDNALGSTAPCGVRPAAAPVSHAGSGSQPVTARVVAPPATPAAAVSVAAVQPPSQPVAAASRVRLASTAAPHGGHGGSLLGRLVVALSACAAVWLVLPRRLLLRVMRR